jgi:hypothetical protein
LSWFPAFSKVTNKVLVFNCFQFYDIAEVATIQKTNLAKFDYK